MFAEGLVVHEEIHEIGRWPRALEPIDEGLGAEGILAPAAVAEAEGDVVAERVGLEQDREVRRRAHRHHLARRASSQDAVDAFGDDAREAALLQVRREALGEDELGVAEHARAYPEELLHPGAVEVDLPIEFLAIEEEREAVVRGLREQLDASGLHQRLERLQHFGSPALELLHRGERDRERHPEAPLVSVDLLEKELVHGQVAAAGHLAHHLLVEGVVEVVLAAADVEDAVAPEPVGLVDLEVEAEIDHGVRSSRRPVTPS